MPDYSNGKIYTIRCRRNNTLIYVGSTTMTLAKRMTEHRYASYTNNIKILYSCVNGNWDDWYIKLYEEYLCSAIRLDKVIVVLPTYIEVLSVLHLMVYIFPF